MSDVDESCGSGLGEDFNSLPGSSQAASDSDGSGPPSTDLGISVNKFFSKRRLNNPGPSSAITFKKRRSHETGKPKTHFPATRRSLAFSLVESGSTPNRIGDNSVAPVNSPTDKTPLTAKSSVEADQSVKSALKEITSLLNTVVKRVERVESELKKSRQVPRTPAIQHPHMYQRRIMFLLLLE